MARFLEVGADQVGRLNADQLVEFVSRLVQAEMARNGIPRRAGSVPQQINIPDGGEDGRAWWNCCGS